MKLVPYSSSMAILNSCNVGFKNTKTFSLSAFCTRINKIMMNMMELYLYGVTDIVIGRVRG